MFPVTLPVTCYTLPQSNTCNLGPLKKGPRNCERSNHRLYFINKEKKTTFRFTNGDQFWRRRKRFKIVPIAVSTQFLGGGGHFVECRLFFYVWYKYSLADSLRPSWRWRRRRGAPPGPSRRQSRTPCTTCKTGFTIFFNICNTGFAIFFNICTTGFAIFLNICTTWVHNILKYRQHRVHNIL